MIEPHLSHFCELLKAGAGTADVQDRSTHVGFAVPVAGEGWSTRNQWIQREVDRVAVHRGNLCAILDEFVGRAERILDVGCGTGATTVAMALTEGLGARELVGLDPNNSSLEASRVRALGHELPMDRISFQHLEPDCVLPLASNRFDLTVSVSVIEYIHAQEQRAQFAAELLRVTKPGGYVYLSTPNPLRLLEHHTGRLLGNQIRRPGFPWANTRRELRHMLAGAEVVPLRAFYAHHAGHRFGVHIAGPLGWVVERLAPWQKLLVRKTG